MPDDTHDMRLLAFVVDGVAQRLAVDGERLVVPAVLLVPALQRAVELFGGDADQEGTDGGLARGGLRTPLRSRTRNRSRALCPSASTHSPIAL